MAVVARCIGAAAFLLVSFPVWGQPENGQVRPVTFSDLEGATVVAQTVHQMLMRRERQFPVRQLNVIRLAFKDGNKLEGRIDITSHTPRGIRKGKSPQFTFTLEQPKELKKPFLGVGHAVWFLENGTLINLRTYKGGAFKREIAFARTADGLSCTIREAFAREPGGGAIELKSAVDGAVQFVVSSKQVSSSCQVVGPK